MSGGPSHDTSTQTMTMRIDVFEHPRAEDLISQSIPTLRLPLNSMNMPDYQWLAVDGHTCGVERKQATELVAEMSVIEGILRKYMDTTEDLALLIEGFLAPHPMGIVTYWIDKRFGDDRLGKGIVFKRSYAQIMAFLWQLDKEGVTVYFTPCLEATAASLVAFYKNSQKEEHTTLRRYVKKRRALWHPNPQVEILLGIPGAGLGEKRAMALIARFETAWRVFNASEDDLTGVTGIGKGIARGLLEKIGIE